ncbi:MAG: asparagine synthase (glutamine-hydrolyzing) [Rhodospirillales bacterium]|nr:asparagine synthase (glutamine-hydrolyzing) [Rhodospirillales bacterium]
MCGIAGLMATDGRSAQRETLDRLADALGHRGPDGRGFYMRGAVGMAQTRLAIIDLETGDQPLFLADEDETDLALVANGEIYNYIELRAELGERVFKTRSDCETPLHLYRRYGVDYVSKLRGMYAIAIHDAAKGRLVLSRDPFGIKPLYYVENGGGFAFASEPQALIAAGMAGAHLNPSARDELLQLQFSTGAGTIFDGVRRVLPGETLVVERGRVVSSRSIAALPLEPPKKGSAGDILHGLDRVLTDSVNIHQRSDVPYGMFLSGGIDSSALLALMARLNQRPVQAFTAWFPGTEATDEREHARAAVAAVGAESIEVEFGESDFWTLLPEIAAAMDDPAADYAVLPTYKLARAAKQQGLKVVLCGEGGDELFAGYGRYRTGVRNWPLARPMRRKGILEGLGVLGRDDPDRNWRGGIAAAEKAFSGLKLTRLQTLQAVDCADWLPHDLLGKLDRCLMAHGIEGRVPFLDREVAKFAFRLPDSVKIKRRMGKWVLRRWLETGMPTSQPYSRKRGFTVPVGEWIAARGDKLGPLVASQPGIAEICSPGAVEALFRSRGDRQGKAAWTLLFYALWHRRHMLGLAPVGDVMTTLGAKA